MADRVTDAELRTRIEGGPRRDTFWWHRTGVLVRVLATALREETLQPEVVYEHNGLTFTRPLADFRERFEEAAAVEE